MPSKEPAFNKVGKQFIGYYDTVRGYVREQLTRRNLEPYLGKSSLKVIDVGGGDARDAIWLAQKGHNVTVVDPSSKMLLAGQRNLKNETSQVASRINFVEGTAATLTGQNSRYDLVLSHGVLMYDLKNPQAHVQQLVRPLRPEGKVSLLANGYNGAVARLDKDPEALANLEINHQYIINVKQRVWAFKPEILEVFLRQAKAQVLEWSGVRIAAEWITQPVSDFTSQQLELILAMEHELGHSKSMRANGQMLHFIAQA